MAQQVSKEAIDQLAQHGTMMQRRVLDEIYFNYEEVTGEIYFDAVFCPPDEDHVYLMVQHRAVSKGKMSSRHADARLVLGDPG